VSRVVHFEIPVDDPTKMSAFYGAVFGWKATKWDGPQEYWLVSTGSPAERGIDGAFLRKRGPDHPLVNTIDVPKIDDAIASVTRHGGQIVVPKMGVPGVGWLAYFKDPEGNITGIMQPDPTAR
jgi:uncharacterized protein